jgi:hypothetical protein
MSEFDIFEIFPDGSFRWRACALGRYDKERRLQELAETSRHQFFAIDIAAGETLPLTFVEPAIGPVEPPGPQRAPGRKQSGLKKAG